MPSFNTLLAALILLIPAEGAAANGAARKLERLEDQATELRRDESAKGRDISAAAKEVAKAKAALAEAESRQRGFEGRLSADRARDPREEDQLSVLKNEVARARAQVNEAEDELRARREERSALKGEVERKEDEIDRAAAKQEREEKEAKRADCPDGNCNGGKKGPANQNPAEKNEWQTIADIVKAVTPLGLGAMNTYLGAKAIDKQSSDYRFYNATNTALGLPSAAPTSYAAFGGGALTSGLGFGTYAGLGGGLSGGLGAWYGGGFAGGIYGGLGNLYGAYGTGAVYNPYASYGNSYAYAGSYSPYVTSPYTATYGTSTVWNSSAAAAAQARAVQQQSIFSADALVAQQSLSGAYSSYNQVLQSVGAIGTSPYNLTPSYGTIGTPTLAGARE